MRQVVAQSQNQVKLMNHPMDTYIFERILIDASRVVALADQQLRLEHAGLRGRFRELLIDDILEPWLPKTVICATGTVISFRNHFRSKTQEDILLIDQSISPSVLIKSHTQEGVYMRNSVLARIEVKSNLSIDHVKQFRKSCEEYRELKLDLNSDRYAAGRVNLMELNMLFAFKSDKSQNTVFSWFNNLNDGYLSAVCVLNHGLWKINQSGKWDEYICRTQFVEAERLAAFVGLMSNTAYHQHLSAQGRDILSSLEDGIGQYFNSWREIGE